MDPYLVTAQQAAIWTGRSVGTIWRWASEGRIKAYRAPGAAMRDVRYHLAELPAKREADDGSIVLGDPPPKPVALLAA